MALDLEDYFRIVDETELTKLPALKIEQLEQHYAQLTELRANLTERRFVDTCAHRMELILSEIQNRRTRGQSEKQHKSSYKIEKQIRFWAVVSGVTGILIFGYEYFPLIRDTFFSKAPPASEPQATPAPPHQIQSTTNVSPEPEASSSSATPSPEQEATAQP